MFDVLLASLMIMIKGIVNCDCVLMSINEPSIIDPGCPVLEVQLPSPWTNKQKPSPRYSQ